MAQLVADCPRCDSNKITFDLLADVVVGWAYDWQRQYEAFCICRHCKKTTTFILAQKRYEDGKTLRNIKLADISAGISINNYAEVRGFICVRDFGSRPAPDYVPDPIKAAFEEGSRCLAIGCPNAAASMFRLSMDLATKPLLPRDETPGLNSKTRRDLGLRLVWLFESGLVPKELRDLSKCIREDGNDGAHDGSLESEDSEDLQDFAVELLERLYTEPKRLELAAHRRAERRKKTLTGKQKS